MNLTKILILFFTVLFVYPLNAASLTKRTCCVTTSRDMMIFSNMEFRAAIKKTNYYSMKKDILNTSEGNLEITVLGHASLMFKLKGQVIYVDPTSDQVDAKALPKADLILITHDHGDHWDVNTVKALQKAGTRLIYTKICQQKLEGGQVLANGEETSVLGIGIKAVPAYNIQHKRDNGEPFHPKGNGNGYVLTIGDKKVYIAGDTEFIPEMKDLIRIDVAFLPCMLPYTMSEDMFLDAAKAIQPNILYPYHYGKSNLEPLCGRIEKACSTEVRLR